MQANKIILNNQVLIDLTKDTVDESKVLSGVTFHKPNGEQAIGTFVAKTNSEVWEFTLEDGTVVTKNIIIGA